MMNNKWQPVSTAPINRLVLVLVHHKGGEEKPYGSLGRFKPTMGWHVNDEYITGSSDERVTGWMELPWSDDEQDMDWIVN